MTEATPETARARGFGVYVHWPYCARICPYCDFNVYRDRASEHDELVAAISADVAAQRRLIDARPVGSVFFGGGTPSRLAPQALGAILEAIDAAFGIEAGAEISLEINPEDLNVQTARGFVGAGVTRASLGAQSLDPDALRDLGRAHTPDDVRRALQAARAADFASVSLDLIYARSHQSLEAWGRELADVLALGADHLSLYQLTIEPQTAFAKAVARGVRPLPDPDVGAAFFELTEAATHVAGFLGYEISNHARTPGHQSRHNLIYWRSGEWIGVGPGAHGRLGPLGPGRRASVAPRRPEAYVEAVKAGESLETEVLSATDQLTEALLMGLRTREGVPLSRLANAASGEPALPALGELLDDGLLIQSAGRLTLAPEGRLLCDAIVAKLIG